MANDNKVTGYANGQAIADRLDAAIVTPSGDPLHNVYIGIGAIWNEDTNKWSLNGIDDLTNSQVMWSYIGYTTGFKVGAFDGMTSLRVLPLFQTSAEFDASPNCNFLFRSSGVERYKSRNDNYPLRPSSASAMFAKCGNLKYVATVDMVNISNTNSMFQQCSSLETCKLKNLKANISLSDSPNLTAESVAYMINNAGTSNITITLHATAKTRALADADVQAALASKTNVTIA